MLVRGVTRSSRSVRALRAGAGAVDGDGVEVRGWRCVVGHRTPARIYSICWLCLWAYGVYWHLIGTRGVYRGLIGARSVDRHLHRRYLVWTRAVSRILHCAVTWVAGIAWTVSVWVRSWWRAGGWVAIVCTRLTACRYIAWRRRRRSSRSKFRGIELG